ncbi:hypothetical protein AVO41_06035 [Thiomicrospira sp. WB1]|nr:hypothetical protein AVO41_06035 [Thiomicrospira sp. WB1]
MMHRTHAPINRWRHLILTGLALLTLSNSIQAEDKLPRYHVEVIVFETLALKGWTEEYWPEKTADAILPDWNELRSMPSPLPQKVHRLATEAKKMTREKGYNKLFHQAWVMTGFPEDQSQPFKIEVLPGNAYQSRLFGQIKFYKSRFAHVRLNLGLERRIPSRVRQDFAQQQDMDVTALPDYWHFQLKESRKIKSGELHYFDHPIFGALVQIQYLGKE